MALTSTEEAMVRDLIAQNAALLALASNEASITAKLAATQVTLSDLSATSTSSSSDLMLVRQGTDDKSMTRAILRAGLLADTPLGALDGMTPAADTFPYFTSDSAATVASLTAFGRSFLDDADAAEARDTLDLGYLAILDTINGGNWSGADLALTDGGTGASSAAAARTNLDLFNKSETRQMAPAGKLGFFAQSAPPSGWLECNGAAVSRTTYADLFAAIGTTYGSGNGSTTFNLPEGRGEFLRGWDNGRGIDASRALGSSQDDELKSHTHGLRVKVTEVAHDSSKENDNTVDPTQGVATGYIEATGGSETRPRNIAFLICIKT